MRSGSVLGLVLLIGVVLLLIFSPTAPSGIAIPTATPTATPIAFNPIDLAPILFLTSDIGVTTSIGNATEWADQSGNDNDFQQINVSNQPSLVSFTFGDKPGIIFDGADDFLDSVGGSSFLTPYDIGYLLVYGSLNNIATCNATNDPVALAISDSAGNGFSFRHAFCYDGDHSTTIKRRNFDTFITAGIATITTDYHLWEWSTDAVSSTLRLDADTLTNDVIGVDGWWWNDVTSPDFATIGAKQSSVLENFAPMSLGVIIALSYIPNATQRSLLLQWVSDWSDETSLYARPPSFYASNHVTRERINAIFDHDTYVSISPLLKENKLGIPANGCDRPECLYYMSGKFLPAEQLLLESIIDADSIHTYNLGERNLDSLLEFRRTYTEEVVGPER